MAVEKATKDGEPGLHGAQSASRAARLQDHFIAELLDWCADLFRSNRARFVRPTDTGSWVVYTRQNGSLSTHVADFAEAAMAHTVGLGRQPLIVSRPRVTRVGATDLRPISTGSYLGIPLICQDRLAGVIECAGDARPDIEFVLHSAMPRLDQSGARLLHDPALLARPVVTPESVCSLTSAFWTTNGVSLTPVDFALLSIIDGSTTLDDAATLLDLDLESACEIAQSLVETGLLAVTSSP